MHHDKRHAVITSVLRKGPADLCGLQSGDRLLSIAGSDVAPIIKSGAIPDAVARVTALIRGRSGSNVTLTVERHERAMEVGVGGGLASERRGKAEVLTVSVMRGQKYEGPRAAPVVVVACISAERCREVADALSPLSSRCPLARIFGAMKAREFTNKLAGALRPARIFVGTPGKLLRLAESGAFDFHNLQLLLADMFVDAKARHLCSMQETRLDFLALYLGVLWPQARDGDLKIAFF